jgi:ATP-dependent protease ClpP protease subunit
MKTINLHGVVGVHISAKDFNDELDNTTGDILLDINSGGGYITDGVAILNKMRSYNKGKIIARVSYAASMMTQIALAADEVQAYDNSIFMIHNALGVAMGDYREMSKREKMLKSMSNMLAQAYTKKTGKTAKQVLKMMDDETYLYGNEIVKEGFADTFLEGNSSDENSTRDEAIAYAHIQLEEVSKALKNEDLTAEQLTACVGKCGFNCGGGLDDENATSAFQDFPMVDQAWDGAAAVRRVRRFMGAEEKPNARYKEAFFWYNNQESENFGAYKLPFADVVDGRLVANVRAVNAANAAMAGARGGVDIPASDRQRVQSHIDRYRDKWQKEQDKGEADTAFNKGNKEKKTMNVAQLKADHPELFAEVVNLGVTQERERVTAHLTMGEASGDMALAVASINDGSEMSANINAKYMAAHMKRKESNDRDGENVPNVNTPNGGDVNDDEAMAKEVAKLLGGDHE